MIKYFPKYSSLLLIFFVSLFLLPKGNKFDTGGYYFMSMFLPVIITIGVFYFRKNDLRVNKLSLGVLLAMFLYLIIGINSYLFSDIQNFGMNELLVDASLIVFLYSILKYDNSNKSKEGKIKDQDPILDNENIKYVLLGSSVLALIGIYLYFFGTHSRLASLFFDPFIKTDAWPNAYAFFLIMLIPINLYLIEKLKYKKIGFLALIAILISFILTFSRAGYLVLICQSLLALIYFREYLSWKSFVYYLLIILFSVSMSYSAINLKGNLRGDESAKTGLRNHLSFQNTSQRTSIQERLDFFQGAFNMTIKKPVLGYGPGSFKFVYPQEQKMVIANSDHPHNLFLKISSERGAIAGIIMLLIFIISLLPSVFCLRQKDIQNPILHNVLLISLMGSLAHSLIDYNLNFLINIILFYGLFGLFLRSTIIKEFKINNLLDKLIIILNIIVLGLVLYEGIILLKGKSTSIPRVFEVEDIVIRDYCPKTFQKSLFPRDCGHIYAYNAYHQGETLKALEIGEWNIEKNSIDSYGFMVIGDLYSSTGKNEQALESYRNMLKNNPKNYLLFYQKYFDQALKMNRKNIFEIEKENTLNVLGLYYDAINTNLHYSKDQEIWKQALELIKTYLIVFPKNEEFLSLQAKYQGFAKKE